MKVEELRKLRERLKKKIRLRNKSARIRIIVGMATSGIASGARETLKAILEEIEKRNLTDVLVTQSGEKGLHPEEPIVVVEDMEKKIKTIYGGVTPEVARMIFAEHIVYGRPVKKYIVQREKMEEE